MPTGITKTILVDDLGENPAMTHRPTGVMYKSRKFLHKLNTGEWKFIELHEEAHAKHNSTSETFCDQYASDQYFKKGGSPVDSVAALVKGLSFQSPEHKARLVAQFKRAAEHDCQINKNEKACKLVNMTTLTALKFAPPIASMVLNAMSGLNGYSVTSCYEACKKTFPNGPVQRTKCMKGCDAEAVRKDQEEKELKAAMMQKWQSLQDASLQKAAQDALVLPELQTTTMQYELEKQRLANEARNPKQGIQPLHLALIAGAALLIIFLIMD
jgi:hypothetical protein